MESNENKLPFARWEDVPEQPPQPAFPTGGREALFFLLIALDGLLLCNSLIFGGLNLGFGLFAGLSLLLCAGYLLLSGCHLSLYSGSLLGLCLVLCAGFARSSDGFVKTVMLAFLLLCSNLGLCLLAGQNRRRSSGLSSLLDSFRAAFSLGLGQFPQSLRGLARAFRQSGPAGRKGGAVLIGLVISMPILAVVLTLLINADAAFTGLIALLPQWEAYEIFPTLFFGCILVCWLYSRAIALRHSPKPADGQARQKKGLETLTVNTVLGAVALVYCAYLLSQLAYFSGGFSGILPEGYSAAEYARRGFFEMAWLCAINLGVIALAAGFVKKERGVPLSTRLLCLFLGLVTLFLVCTASAKMALYIGSYGLTRLRVLTEVITVFLGLATALVSLWLFLPRLPYMKAVVLTALVLGCLVFWADVDTVVARYNVTAYQSGRLESVDVDYLSTLSPGALPYIRQLADDSDPKVADMAKTHLHYLHLAPHRDFRSWNFALQQGLAVLEDYRQ